MIVNFVFISLPLCKGGGGDDDDGEEGAVVLSKKADDKFVITPKWPTRVFAMECIRMILQVCKSHQEHVDLALARKMKEENSSGIIYMILSIGSRNFFNSNILHFFQPSTFPVVFEFLDFLRIRTSIERHLIGRKFVGKKFRHFLSTNFLPIQIVQHQLIARLRNHMCLRD